MTAMVPVRESPAEHLETARRPLWKTILRVFLYMTPLALGIAAGAAVSYELETSALQARLFSQYVPQLSSVSPSRAAADSPSAADPVRE